jgi:photosystem II stability/assembly factor-like uncharacterized protein
MKSGCFAAGVMILASIMTTLTAHAAEAEEALCRGTYPVLLMTEQECSSYIRQVKDLQSTGQVIALASLRQQHAAQLDERAAICPCIKPKPQAVAPQHLVMLDPDC